MAAFQINDDEWNALCNEPAEVFKIYCALRRAMNFETGIAGLPPYRINEQFFRDALFVEAIRGRKKSGFVTRQKIRSIIERLEVLGLINHKGNLVFELNLATLGNSVQNINNRSATRTATRTATNFKQTKTLKESGLKLPSEDDQQPYQQPTTSTISNPPQVSGKKKKDITNVISKKESFDLPEWLSTEDWENFLEHRKSIKNPMTELAQRLAIKKLGQLREQGNDVAEVINQSIVNGWKGFFEIKGGAYATRQQSPKQNAADIFRQIQDEFRAEAESIEGEFIVE